VSIIGLPLTVYWTLCDWRFAVQLKTLHDTLGVFSFFNWRKSMIAQTKPACFMSRLDHSRVENILKRLFFGTQK
jgi:hypothetical protein